MSGPRCPICREVLSAEATARPFCSPRCRLIDLGHWLDGRYRIAALDDGPSSDGARPDTTTLTDKR